MNRQPAAGCEESREGFDPATNLFVAQARRPAGLQAVAMSDLSEFQRGLLATDGTVTRFVEACWLEPVAVVRLAQSEASLPADDPWLALPAGAPVVHRRVLLHGWHSQRFCAWADSLIAIGRLAPGVRRGLEVHGGGLGRILIDNAMETRREALWFGRERPDAVPARVSARWSGDFLVRSYRVFAAGEPIMFITERFAL